jgi:cytochrome P450
MSEPRLDDPAFYADDPDRALAEARRHCPVQWYAPGSFWSLTRHADVAAVSKDPEHFRSGGGVLISDRLRSVNSAESILYLDPPVHAHYRKLVSRAFTPRRVVTLEPRIRALAAELLDELDPAAPVDLVDTVAAPLPLLVIAELLGVPAEHRADFRRWSDGIMAAATALTEENAVLAMELLTYFDRQLDDRSRAPRDDLLSALVTAEVDGEQLTRPEQLGFCMTLLVAGNETTRSLISGGLVVLAQHPGQRAKIAADPDLMADAVEEMLRWVTPIMAMARSATTDTELGGERVCSGDYVVMQYAAANRDVQVFGADADRFDVTRTPNPHLAFGVGEHFCLGAGLARLEARILLQEFLSRWPDYAIVGPVSPVPSTLLRQLGRVPVQLDPRVG